MTCSKPWFSSAVTSVSVGSLRPFCLRLSRWPRTLAGITAHLQCTRNTHSGGIYPGNAQDERKAWRRCDRGGFWADDDYSRCQYANDVTRVLYMFNQVTGKSSDRPRVLIKRGTHTKYIRFFFLILVKHRIWCLYFSGLCLWDQTCPSQPEKGISGITLPFQLRPDSVPLPEYLHHLYLQAKSQPSFKCTWEATL